MRWKAKKIPVRRIIKRFLIFPKCINGEWKWLEIAYILQNYDGYGNWSAWQDERFMKKEDDLHGS